MFRHLSFVLFTLFCFSSFALEQVADVLKVVGGPKIERKNGDLQKLAVRDLLFQGDQIITGPDDRCVVVFRDDTIVEIGASTKVDIHDATIKNSTNRKLNLHLESGKVRARVLDKLKGSNSSIKVKTRSAVAAVRGTDFFVESDSTKKIEKTRIGVIEGTVQVFDIEKKTEGILKTGQFAEITSSLTKELDKLDFEQGLDTSNLKSLPGFKSLSMLDQKIGDWNILLDSRMNLLNSGLEKLDTGIGNLMNSLDQLESKMSILENKLGALDALQSMDLSRLNDIQIPDIPNFVDKFD